MSWIIFPDESRASILVNCFVRLVERKTNIASDDEQQNMYYLNAYVPLVDRVSTLPVRIGVFKRFSL